MKIDMSPQAVTARLRAVEQLRRLCLALGQAPPQSRMSAPAPNADPSCEASPRARPVDSAPDVAPDDPPDADAHRNRLP